MTAGPFLHIARDDTGVDVEAAERAAAGFLSALGIDVDREDLRDTPGRMARAYAELFSSRPLRLTTFANDEGYDELVVARAIPFRTVCEHHLLPFSGVATCCRSPASRTSATCPASASSGCPSWPGWWSTSRPGPRSRNG